MPAPHRFTPGSIVATPAVLATATNQVLLDSLNRHLTGDWGEVSAEDAKANEDALAHDARLLSVYTMTSGGQFWIITEADRSATTFLLPSDY
jgi:hypothetical protein